MVDYTQTAVDGRFMGEGPGVAIPRVLERAGMDLADMDLIEVNEAFASQVLANQQVLEWDPDKLNVHGGAIALGHPTGLLGRAYPGHAVPCPQADRRRARHRLHLRRRRLDHGHDHPAGELDPPLPGWPHHDV